MLKYSDSRSVDLQIASSLATRIDESVEDHFVLTGSYSIDILTGADIIHNDIDANVFTDDVSRSLGRAALLFKRLPLTRQTDSRLEYLVPHDAGETQVELQFVQYDRAEPTPAGWDFYLPGRVHPSVIVPVVHGAVEVDGLSYDFLIKSLPFAIGTWALRISGVAMDQKREVRQTDLDHFLHLAARQYDSGDVMRAMVHHPQAPTDYDVTRTLDAAIAIAESGARQ